MSEEAPLLVVGEIVVDFTAPRSGEECKLRLGGIVHAARGLWACDIPYAVAAVCPAYLVDQARRFLERHGCRSFVWIGDVSGSPNVVFIGDVTEVSHQGYEDLLREEKSVEMRDVGSELSPYSEAIVFPGSFDLPEVSRLLPDHTQFSFDVAYDIMDFAELGAFSGHVRAIAISTSSPLFDSLGSKDVAPMLAAVAELGAEVFLLKENRGGSRVFEIGAGTSAMIPATLSSTVNSVGVGDVYTAVLVGLREIGWGAAAWRGADAATAYSQTTYPDDFKRDVQRSLKLTIEELRDLGGGTILPWHARPEFQIYLAAPDFSYVQKPEVDRAVEALKYHNFRVRRPIQENGELPLGSPPSVLRHMFANDVALLQECSAVFAVPLERDPGTLVEIGIAIARGIPVVTYDPRRENNNTMVAGGSAAYSDDLDICLNGLFTAISKVWLGRS